MNGLPILFRAPMVRAIIEGRKTQTRRVIKPVRGFEKHDICKPEMAADPWAVWWHGSETDRVGCLQECPYGKPGDRLWVRETWAAPEKRMGRVAYNADGLCGAWLSDGAGGKTFIGHGRVLEAEGYHQCFPKRGAESHGLAKYGGIPRGPYPHKYGWRPSIFMPRWASRITLEITEVRVQRVQEISGEDVLAEGVTFPGRDGMLTIAPIAKLSDDAFLRNAYLQLWDSINAKRGFPWATNPWAWAITFKRVEKENHAAQNSD